MLPELQRLVELQEIDREILHITYQIEKEIPAKISEITSRAEGLKKESQRVHQRLEEIEKRRRQKELDLQEMEDRIKKLKARSSEVKTNKEYQALLNEIQLAEKEKSRIEDEILNLMETIEQVKVELRSQEAEIKRQQTELEERKREFLTLQDKSQKALELLKGRRSELIKEISSSYYDLYMSLLEKGRGLAVVSAVDEVCQGCYLKLPPQLFVEIKRNERLIQCPQCRRILYWKPDSVEVEKTGQ